MSRLKAVVRVLFLTILFAAIPSVQAADVTYEYDAKGRLVKVIYEGSGKTIEYFYDEANNRTQVVITSNSPPVAVNDATWNFGFSARVYVLNNDSDPDSDPLTVTSTTVINGSGTATVACSNTCVDLTTTDFVTANYTISDGNGGTDTATVSFVHLNPF